MVEILCTAKYENDVAHLFAVGTIETFTWIPPAVKDRSKECNRLERLLEHTLMEFRSSDDSKLFCLTPYDWVSLYIKSIPKHYEIKFERPPYVDNSNYPKDCVF